MLRARFSLELMEHGRTTFRRSGSLSLEVLRRFEAEAGFYVDSQAPLESLRPTGTVGCLRGGGAFGLRCLAVPESRHPPSARGWFRVEPGGAGGGGGAAVPRAAVHGAAGYGVLAVAVASPLATWLDGGTPSPAPKVGIDPVPCLNQ